jgi:hypothetical protein
VNKKVTRSSLLLRGALILIGYTCLSGLPGVISSVQAQSNQSNKKVIIQNTKPVGFKDSAATGSSKTNSLNPALFQRKDPNEIDLDSASNLDYRVAILMKIICPPASASTTKHFQSFSKTKRRHSLIGCAGTAFLTLPHSVVAIALTPSAL